MSTDSDATPVQITDEEEEEGGGTNDDGDLNSNGPQSDVVDSSVTSEDQDSEHEDHVYGGNARVGNTSTPFNRATFVSYRIDDSSDSDMARAASRNHRFARFGLTIRCFDDISNQEFQELYLVAKPSLVNAVVQFGAARWNFI